MDRPFARPAAVPLAQMVFSIPSFQANLTPPSDRPLAREREINPAAMNSTTHYRVVYSLGQAINQDQGYQEAEDHPSLTTPERGVPPGLRPLPHLPAGNPSSSHGASLGAAPTQGTHGLLKMTQFTFGINGPLLVLPEVTFTREDGIRWTPHQETASTGVRPKRSVC